MGSKMGIGKHDGNGTQDIVSIRARVTLAHAIFKPTAGGFHACEFPCVHSAEKRKNYMHWSNLILRDKTINDVHARVVAPLRPFPEAVYAQNA